MKAFLFMTAMALAAPSAATAWSSQSDGQAEQLVDQRDPAAMAALDRMGAALRKQMNFSVHSEITAEDVLMSGQKLQYNGTVDIDARRPGALRMILNIAGAERQLYYDGKKLTLYSPRQNVYATAAAPATIRDMLVAAGNEYGLEIPLADLFAWGDDTSLAERVESAFFVGKERVGELTCDHYAMRQEMVDWQVWIREGEDALPCKLVITSTDDPAMPQVSAVYHWNLRPVAAAEAFTFAPPAGASPIIFRELKLEAKTSKAGN